MKYLFANWKAEMTPHDISKWMQEWEDQISKCPDLLLSLKKKNLVIVICPSYPCIPTIADASKKLSIAVGAQDVSRHGKGKFTGEVTADQIKEYVDFVLVGHSERRIHERETEKQIKEKIQQLTSAKLKSVLCIRDAHDVRYSAATILAFEPVGSIGTGEHMDPQEVVNMKNSLNLPRTTPFLYGGSVDEKNIPSYLATCEIDGFLVGTASLRATSFLKLALACIQ